MARKRMKLLIGYAGSNETKAAIEDLVHAGLPHDIEALIVSVCDSPTVAPFASHDVIERAVVGDRVTSMVNNANFQVSEEAKRASELVVNAEMRLHSDFPSGQVRSAILSGNPAVEIVKKAKMLHPDTNRDFFAT